MHKGKYQKEMIQVAIVGSDIRQQKQYNYNHFDSHIGSCRTYSNTVHKVISTSNNHLIVNHYR